MPALHLATFTADATPPKDHPLCGGWITPVVAVDVPLQARGLILLGAGAPVVLCTLDWVGVRNDAYKVLRDEIAKRTHTTAERVQINCVHPHNTPFVDPAAQKLLDEVKGPPNMFVDFFEQLVARIGKAAVSALEKTTRITHIGTGKSKVEQVASARRILGPANKVIASRTSACKDPKVRAEPEGLIDPWLRTVSLWNDTTPVAVIHHYATHPMSYYGDGKVTPDFCGLARDVHHDELKGPFVLYLTGCAGNITAGKYNDGAPENRPILRDRMLTAMRAAFKVTEKQPLEGYDLRSVPVHLPLRKEPYFSEEESRKALADDKLAKARRGNAALHLGWILRKDRPIDFTCLDLGPVRILQLPGEPFIEYQLFAQGLLPDRFVCAAGYGDGGPGYLPTDVAYDEGGYEPTVALEAPSEPLIRQTLAKLLQVKP